MFTRWWWDLSPVVVVQRFEEVVNLIRSADCGGEGIGGKSSILAQHERWLYEVAHPTTSPLSEKELRRLLIFIANLEEHLPNEYSRMLKSDSGYQTLVNVLSGVDHFALCSDCRAPLYKASRNEVREAGGPIKDDRDGCPYCSDGFPVKPRYAISFTDPYLPKWLFKVSR